MARVSPASCNASPVSGPRCCNPKRFSRCVARSAIPDGATACSRRSPPCSSSSVLREVRYHIGAPGFRTRQITLVSTLLEAAVYRVDDLVELSRRRWQLETALAHLKTTMQMEVLHCQTVPGMRAEPTCSAQVCSSRTSAPGDPEFQAQYVRRAGGKGTHAQAIRRRGLRRSPYVGLAKTHLQHVITAVALNLVRLVLLC